MKGSWSKTMIFLESNDYCGPKSGEFLAQISLGWKINAPWYVWTKSYQSHDCIHGTIEADWGNTFCGSKCLYRQKLVQLFSSSNCKAMWAKFSFGMVVVNFPKLALIKECWELLDHTMLGQGDHPENTKPPTTRLFLVKSPS